jgi:hypothetical protein
MGVADGAGPLLGIPVAKAAPAAVKRRAPTLTHGRLGSRRATRRQPTRLSVERGADRPAGSHGAGQACQRAKPPCTGEEPRRHASGWENVETRQAPGAQRAYHRVVGAFPLFGGALRTLGSALYGAGACGWRADSPHKGFGMTSSTTTRL